MTERWLPRGSINKRKISHNANNVTDVPQVLVRPLYQTLPVCGPEDTSAVHIPSLSPEATVKLPLTPSFKVAHGGGRSYGGGTSKEAIRIAKQKAKRETSRK